MLIVAIIGLGLAAGWVAHLLVGKGQANWRQLFVIGLVGSFIGGLIGSLLFSDGLRLRPSGLVGSVVGATLVLLVVNAVNHGSRHMGGRRA